MRNKKTLFITQAAMIAALYVVLTYLSNAFGLASGNIQIRLSEALTILPFFTFAAVPGLYIGCLISNLLIGSAIIDIVIGSLATLLGAIGSYYLRKHKYLCMLPPIISNTIRVPFVLRYAYGMKLPIPVMMLTVGVGEGISVFVFGGILINVLQKYRSQIFQRDTFK